MKRIDTALQEQKEQAAIAEGFTINVDHMSGWIGGSSMDDLRDDLGLDTFMYNEDVMCKVIDYDGVDFSAQHDELEPGETYLARCTAFDCEDYVMVLDYIDERNDFMYTKWVPYHV